MLLRLSRYLLPQKTRMLALLASMLLTSVVEMLVPWPIKFVVDNVLGHQPAFGIDLQPRPFAALLVLAAAAYALLAALRGLFGVLRQRWTAQVGQAASLALRGDLYTQVQRLSLGFYDRARTGDMVTRITRDVDKLQEAFVDGLSLFSVDLVTVLGIAATMLLVDWRFGLVSLLVVPPLLIIFGTFRGRVKEAARAVRSGEGAMASLSQEVLSTIRVVRAFGQEQREQVRFMDQTRSMADATIRAATWQGVFDFWVEVATAGGIALVLAYGASRVAAGELTLGTLLVFMQYVTTLYLPIRRLTRLTTVVQKASASAERIGELFQAAPDVTDPPNGRVLGRATGRLELRDVWFEYVPGRPILRGITLDVAPGEVVALVGSTGSGKSTLASLLTRMYDPTAGEVRLDGLDIREVRLRSLRAQFSMVLQDTALFAGTIRDNIAYGKPDATDEEIIAAARAAHAHGFISELPNGYATEVGERGVTLSGGQRQRIAIARALLRNAPVLIMDEPTSAVDPESERLILDALKHLVRGRTVLIITHRPSLTQLANRVVTLANGTVSAKPSVEEPDLARPGLALKAARAAGGL
jgi:subfamily B ATP-binding cassette protein MsbA